MPTRIEKQVSAEQWTVYCHDGDYWVSQMLNAEDPKVSVVSHGKNWVTLLLRPACKWDRVYRFCHKVCKKPNMHFDIKPAVFATAALRSAAACAPGQSSVVAPTVSAGTPVSVSVPAVSAGTPAASAQVPAGSAAVSKLAAARLVDALSNGALVDVNRGPEEGGPLTRGRKLGQGTFGAVFECLTPQGHPVAAKVFTDTVCAKNAEDNALLEASIAAAVPRHPNLVQILDVRVGRGEIQLIYPLFDLSLNSALALEPERKVSLETARRVAQAIAAGLSALHASALVHADVKPANVLLRTPVRRIPLKRKASSLLDWERVEICVADLGGAVFLNPALRIAQSPKKGLSVCTVPYRAPEIILGDVNYGAAADAWSLGCVIGEMLSGKMLFANSSEIGVYFQITALLGSPQPEGRLAQLPNFKTTFPRWPPKSWPPPWLPEGPAFADVLRGLLEIEPARRLSVSAAAASAAFTGVATLSPSVRNVPATRGGLTLCVAKLDPTLRGFLQNDPYWPVAVPKFLAREGALKDEQLFYIGDEPPGCATCNKQPATQPLPARRVRAFLRVFLRKNSPRLLQLQEMMRRLLNALPPKYRGDNGNDFLNNDILLTALCYVAVQLMRARARLDPGHFDGGASWLHLGLSMWGRRRVTFDLVSRGGAKPCGPEDELEGYSAVQEPGSVYLGNVVAAFHQVAHYQAQEAEPLFRTNEDDEGVLVAVMVRSDVFRGSRARGPGTPSPSEVFEIVNACAAEFLATGSPFEAPTLTETKRELERLEVAVAAASKFSG